MHLGLPRTFCTKSVPSFPSSIFISISVVLNEIFRSNLLFFLINLPFLRCAMAAIVNFLVKTVVPISGLLYAEQVYFRVKLAPVYAASSMFPGWNVPKAFGLVLAVNIILSGFLLVYLGTKVGAARNAFKEKALKDGDKDAEARFSYPKMQAEGFSEHAKLFNCVQRGHQQALETYTFFVGLSVISGILFPLSTVFAGLLWFFSRVKWAEGYRTGEPSKRYQNWVAYGIWTSLIIVMVASIVTSVQIMQ